MGPWQWVARWVGRGAVYALAVQNPPASSCSKRHSEVRRSYAREPRTKQSLRPLSRGKCVKAKLRGL
jgi:hypothetical protein